MKVYLTGEHGSENAIEKYLEDYKGSTDFYDWISSNWSWGMPKVYVTETDSKTPVKKLNKKSWIEEINYFAMRHTAEYTKFILTT